MAEFVWHPPRAVLELAELAATGALARLPERLRPALPDRSPDAVLVLEDAEGTPVAAVRPDLSVEPRRPFAHGPLRSRRVVPADVRAAQTHPALAVPVAAALTTGQVGEVTDVAHRGGAGLVWFVLVGAGRHARPAGTPAPAPEALLRATARVAAQAGGAVVPLALPQGFDDLLPEIAAAHGASGVVDVGALDPAGDVHPEFAVEVAREAARPRGAVVFLTGLSGSGKSTVAKALAERLLDDGSRRVTMLDGDEVRRLLSHGLGFSRADRDLNIRRIGFVAAEVARHGGLAVCAPIAPFASVRAEVRDLVEDAGGEFLLVHVATPLEECERRDRKGLYARARRGELPDFTGISSPYEVPDDADLVLDTTGVPVEESLDAVWALLEARDVVSGARRGAPGAR